MTTILGNNTNVYLDSVLVFCAKDCLLTESKDTVEMAGGSALSGTWTYHRLQRRSWKVDCSGLTKVNSDDGQLDYFSIIDDPYATDFHVLMITWEDADGNNVTFTGNVFIPQSGITGSVKEFANATVSMIGTGPYDLSNDVTSGSGSGGEECVPVSSGAFNPPDGTLEVAYSYTLALSGTAPFSLGTVSGKPSWMTMSVATGSLVLGGTPTTYPTDVGTFFLDIVINNACGSIHLIDEGGATIEEAGIHVQVINESSFDVVLENSNGHSYSIPAGTNLDIINSSDTISIITVDGGTTQQVHYEFLVSLPSSLINQGNCQGGDDIVTADFSSTAYLRFTDI